MANKIQIREIETTGVMSVVVLNPQTVAKIVRARFTAEHMLAVDPHLEEDHLLMKVFNFVRELEDAILGEENEFECIGEKEGE